MSVDDRHLVDLVRQFDVLCNKRQVDFKNKRRYPRKCAEYDRQVLGTRVFFKAMLVNSGSMCCVQDKMSN